MELPGLNPGLAGLFRVCMSSDCGRKPDYLDKTYMCRLRSERPGTFLPWGDSTNQHTTGRLLGLFSKILYSPEIASVLIWHRVDKNDSSSTDSQNLDYARVIESVTIYNHVYMLPHRVITLRSLSESSEWEPHVARLTPLDKKIRDNLFWQCRQAA